MAETAPALASSSTAPTSPPTSSTGSVLMLVIMVLGITALLSAVAVYWKQNTIETELSQQTRQAFMEAGLPLNNIRFDGRDGILSGSAPSEAVAMKSATVAQAVEGVRSIDNRLIIKDPKMMDQNNPATQQTTAAASLTASKTTPTGEHPLEKIDLSQVTFVYAKADLTADAYTALDNVHQQLTDNPSVSIEIGVHTDNSGTAIGNMAISQIRAESITQYLISRDIDSARLQAKGYGATQPIADNSDDAGRSKNRRVTLKVLSQ